EGTALTLKSENLVIADAAGAVALAGVMGGKNSEVNASTHDILLESAYFEPTGIYRTSRATKTRTESSIRFEKGVDLKLVEEALDWGAKLLADLCGGEISPQKIDTLRGSLKKRQLTLDLAEVKRILGLELSFSAVKKILVSLGFDFVKRSAARGQLVFAVPFGRARDIEREIDLIEEIIRVYGYDRIPANLPHTIFEKKFANPYEEFVEQVRGELSACGLDEIKTYSMVSSRDFDCLGYAPNAPERNCPEISNPLSSDAAWLRPSLLPGLLKTIELNQNWQAAEQAFFEIDKVFLNQGKGAEETLWAAAAVLDLPQQSHWQTADREKTDFYWFKGILQRILGLARVSSFEVELQARAALQPGLSAVCRVKQHAVADPGLPVAYLGKLHPAVAAHYKIKKPVYILEINLSLLFGLVGKREKYRPLPKYPAVDRDVAMIVSADISYQSIRDSILKSAGARVEKVELFDLFAGQNIPPGHYSLALHVVYRDQHKTLSDDEVNQLHARVLETLKDSLKIEIRM
ncbi:MAG: phenylalanine--tRNA ligase subunit beta, partial [Candidatus Margulisiibacteriota bacterium]